MYVKKYFRLPPGVSARVIAFLPHTRGLFEYASHLGIRTVQGKVATAISMALVAFGQHPDHHPDVRDQLLDMFGHRLRPGMEPETVAKRIARFGAPKSSMFARSDAEKSMLMAFSDEEDDDNYAQIPSAQTPSTQRKRCAATAFSSVDRNDENTQTPAQKKRCAAFAFSSDDAGNDEVDNDETEYDETEGDEEEGNDSGALGPSTKKQC
ncbi:hypothetical protein EV127DRAFT_477837 [Xylaria flabelliformis]|nr:hypothetical protein EV127DRAFT_477837 [Xylaria flabelliformis]